MSKQETSRKPLIIGIVAAVVILAVLLGLLLTQCAGGGDTTQSTPAQTVGYIGEAEDYDLYWNLDRALYDGKSEAGMSSRKPESDGYFHVRFFIDGKIVELKVADRKTVNAIEVNDLMGLEFDKDGIVVGVISLDDMPLQQVGWKFYVQSIGGNLLKLNSAKTFDGMELLLEMLDDTGLYDMTGIEGEVGKRIKPIAADRVIAIANLEGKLTHVFIYERSEYMQTVEAECRHCKQTVTWKLWNKTDRLPTADGHYKLDNDIQMKTQSSIEEDAKVCLDLNGKVVDGPDNKRMYSLHNVGANLALMDTSEEQTGVLRGHSTSSPQGGVVWVRYGAFYLYSGTLDASDMTSVINGTAVQVPKESFFYMYGGTIIGGTSKFSYNEQTKKYGNGMGGAVAVSGKFVMNDGLITGGQAQSAITAWNKDGTPKTYQRGMGGNIAVFSGATFEMRGGKIQNGVATHSGGNIYLDGTAQMTLDGGMITGGCVAGKGRNGGNVFVGSKASLEMNGGSINWGTSYNCGANLYFNGTVQMNGGYIGKGTIRTFGTGKVKPADSRTNVFQVGGKMIMYGGIIEGGYTITDTSATDKTITTLILGGIPVIAADETSQYDDLVLTNGGSGVKVIVGTLVKGSKIGVNATTGIFTTPTAKANAAAFYSTIEGADILYVDGCIALGRMSCVCGSQEHFGDCDGTQLLWAPINSNTIPNTTGNYFLAKDVTISAQVAVAENADVKIDLNGKTLTGPKNKRVLTTFNEGAKLTLTDSSEGKTGVVKSYGAGDTQGNVAWARYGRIDFYGGTLDGSEYKLHTNWSAGKDGVFGTKDDATSGRDGGTVSLSPSTTFNMYGGTIIGNTAEAYVAEKTVTEGEGEDAVKTVVTRNMVSPSGASLSVGGKAVFNMYAGTIRDGFSGNTAGNIYVNSGTVNMYGGTISGGKAGPIYDEAGEKVVTKGWGGNIDVNNSGTFNFHDGLITGGVAGGNGGNIRISHPKAAFNMYGGVVERGESLLDQGGNMFLSGTVNLTGGIVRDGKAANGGNLGVNSTKDVTLKGVTITGGEAKGNGGNIRMSTTSTEGNLIIAEGTVISGGRAIKYGGNISVESNNANKNDPIAKMIITGGTIEGGRAGAYDENGLLALKEANGKKKSEKTQLKSIQIDGKNVTVEVVVTTTEIRTSAVISQGWGGNINMGANTVLEMSGGDVLDGKAMNGGNLYVGGASDVKLQGGNISGGVAGCFDAEGNLAKVSYTVITEERLKLAEEYEKPESFTKNEEAKFNARLETQKNAAEHYVAPEAKTTTKQENICTGWGGNIYLYIGSKTEVSGATVSNGKSGGNGGGIYVNGKDCSFTMTSGTLSGNTSVSDNGGNLWVGSNGVLKLLGGTLKDGAAYGNGGNLHTNANVSVLLDNVTISGGLRRGAANYKNANVNLSASEDITFGNVKIAGYVNIASDVKLVGKPVIKGGEINLTLNGNKLDVSKLDAGKELAMVGISDSKLGIFSGKTDPGVTAYFFSDHQDKGVIYVDGHLALGLGKTYCLCGHTTGYSGEHLPGCDKNTQRFWQGWTSTSSLPIDSGNYYLTGDVTLSSAATIQDTESDWQLVTDRAGTTIVLNLNGYTVQNKEDKNIRLYRTNTDDVSLTITDTVGGGALKNNGTYTQGGLVWLAGKNNSLNLITGILDVSDYTSVHNGGAAVAVAGEGSVFTMYGGTIYAPGAKTGEDTYGTGMGCAVNVDSKGTMYLKGGHIEGGLNIHRLYGVKSDDGDGNITNNVGGGLGGAMTIAGRLEMSGGTVTGGRAGYGEVLSKVTKEGKETWSKTGGNAGNIYVTGTMIMTGGVVSNGQGGALIEVDGKQVFAPHTITVSESGKQTTTKRGGGGNIEVSGSGVLEISGTAQVLNGIVGGNGGNIRTGSDCVFKMTGGTVTGGESVYDQGGNLFLSSESVLTGGEISGGKASNGGNIGINTAKEVLLQGVKVLDGEARGNGGNIRTFSTNADLKLTVAEGTVISGGRANGSGGNISVESYQSDDAAHLAITGGTIEDGRAGKYDQNGKLAFTEKESTKKTKATETRTIKIGGESVEVDVIVTTTETRHFALSGTGNGGNINIGVRSTLDMTGGNVENGEATNGGNIYFAGTCDVKLQGGKIAGGHVGFFDEEEKLVKWTYDVLVEERLKVAEDYKEGEADEEKLALQKKAEEFYQAPEAKTSKKSENASAGWGGNLYLYDGAKVELSGATVSGGVSGGNGGGVYIRGKDCVFTMTGGELSGNRTAFDNGGNLWAGSGTALQIIGGTIKNGSAYKNGGNIHTNALVTTLLDNVTISGGTVNGKTNNKSANVNLMAGDVTIGSVNIAGYVTVASDVKLIGKPVIKGGEQNLNLAGQMLDVSKLEGGEIGVTSATQGIISGKADEAMAAFFFSDDKQKDAVYAAEYEALGLGRLQCLCGKEAHLDGCDKNTKRFWHAWTSTSSLPVDSGNYYLTDDVTISSQISVANDEKVVRDGSSIAIDLNGHTVQNKPGKNTRLYWVKVESMDLTVTDTVGGGTMKNNSTYTQGGLIWLSGKNNTLSIISGIYDTSDYNSTYGSGGAAIALEGSNNTFYMYGGTIYAPGAKVGETYGKGLGAGGAVFVAASDTMYLCGGHIEGGLSIHREFSVTTNADGSVTYKYGGGNGGAMVVAGHLEMSGGTINGGRASYGEARKSVDKDGKVSWSKLGGHGGNIYLTGTMDMIGGTISNGQGGAWIDGENGQKIFAPHIMDGEKTVKKGWGGNIEVATTGKLWIGGDAKILNGTSGGNGGNIYVGGSGSELTIGDGQIVGGTSVYDNGGNLWIGGKSNITISGGLLKDGSANNYGGNIHANAGSDISILGGEITGGKVAAEKNTAASNVNLMGKESNIVIGSTKIDGYVNIGAGNSVKLIGKPVITGGNTNLTLNDNDMDITELDVGEDKYKIGISDDASGIFTGTATKGAEEYFYSDDASKLVGFMNGKLSLEEGNVALGRYTCRCARPGGVCVGTEGGCDGETHFWAAWTYTDKIPTQHGYWYLTNDVKTGAQFNMEKDATIHIDLNGHIVTDTGSRTVSTAAANKTGNVTLWITDSSINGTGTMKLQYAKNTETNAYAPYNGQGGILWVASESQVNLIAGTLDARESANSKDVGGGAVHIAGAGARFTMYGGTIYGAEEAVSGAAVSVYAGGEFVMKNGTIYGGKATRGGSVYVFEDSFMTVEGGTISGGEAEFGGNIEIAPNAQVQLNGGIVKEGKAIRYDKTGGYGGNIHTLGALTIDGATVSDGKAGTLDADGNVIFTSSGWGGNIHLDRLQDAEDKTLYYCGSLDLISGTIEKGNSKGNGGSIYIQADASMSMSGGTITEGKSNADQGGNIFCSGNLSITGGKIEKGTAKNGGNIGVNTTATVSITGGTISDGTASSNGGNIRLNSTNTTCAVDIGGSADIKNGTAKYGGNISINRVGEGKTAVVNVQGGTITGGTATEGGSIFAAIGTQLNVSDGTITGGTASYGGSTYLEGGAQMYVTGGTITGGSALNGGNIYVAKDQDSEDKTLYHYGSLSMTGGTITGGSVAKDGDGTGEGGNIWTAGNVNISGGTVSNGTAGVAKTDTEAAKSGWGGNIFIKDEQLILGGDASVTGGWANNNGGSIHVAGGVMQMTGGSVTNGTTYDRGGNIFVAKGKALTVTGGTISGGTAGGTITEGVSQNNKGGGNISTNEAAIVSLSNVTISDGHVDNRQLYRANMEINKNVKLTIGDGTTIDGGVGCTSTGVVFNMSGKVIIDGGEGCTNNVTLNNNVITLGEMKDGSRVLISQEGRFTSATEEANKVYFAGDKAGQDVTFITKMNKDAHAYDNSLWLGHYDCLCAGAGENGACVGAAGGCTSNKVLWTPWPTDSTLAALPNVTGNWYLTNNVEMTAQVRNQIANQIINLDLNGKTVQNKAKTNMRMYWLNASGIQLTVTDGVGTGKMINSGKYDQGAFFWLGSANTVVNLLAGELDATGYSTRGNSSVGGVAVDLSGTNAAFNMYGGKLMAGTGLRGLAVSLEAASAQFNMYGGEIIGGTATFQKSQQSGAEPVYSGGEGGAIYVNGIFNMYGGKISGGKAVAASLNSGANAGGGLGDNVYAASEGVLNISGGEIVGGVDASAAKSVTVSGTAKIDRGTATNTTYSLKLGSNKLTIGTLADGAKFGITANEGPFTLATDNANVAYFFADDANKTIVHMDIVDKSLWLGHYDCQCAGVGKDGACVGAAGGCTESKLVWMPWTSTNSLPTKSGNWYLTDDVALPAQLNGIASGEQINLDLNGKTVTTSTNRGIWLKNTNITLTITDSVGGGTFKNTAKHDQGGIFWIAAGNCHVRLINGIMDATDFTNRGTNNFGGAAVVVASSTGKFTMYGGEIKANKDATDNIASAGAAVAVSSSGGVFELHGGKIYGGKAQYQVWDNNTNSNLFGGMGGAVYITSGATMTMDGGEIIGGSAIAATATDTRTTTDTKTGGGLGGAVYLAGTLNMSGGKISGGSAVSALDSASKVVGGKGDNVYVASTGALNISGGEIVGGVDASEASSVTVSGTAKIDRGEATNTTYSLALGSKELTVGTLADGAKISITAEEGAFTNEGRTAADLAYFAADSTDQAITFYGGKLHLGKYACLCGSTTNEHKSYNDNGVLIGCDGTKVAWTPWASTELLPTKTGNFYLTDNVILTTQASLAANSDVVLDLNGYKVTPVQENGKDKDIRMISIHNSGAKLTLTDTYVVPETTSADYDPNRTGGEIVGSTVRSARDTGNVVWVRWANGFTKGTTFVMLGGKLTAADVVGTGNGGVVSAGNECKFYMLGGTITGGKNSNNGANIYISAKASMVMTGGTISDGDGARGANVYLGDNTSFTMTGGTITNGKASSGGNIYIGKNSTFDVSGTAVISKGSTKVVNGKLEGNGGNIYLNDDAQMTLENATVTEGNAKNGGNICINKGATMTMDSGSVTKGTGTNGQGIQVFGSLVVNGGKIEKTVQVFNWNVLSGASITLSGAAELEQIKLNRGTDKTDMNVDDIEIPVITINGTLATTVTEGNTTRTLAPINVATCANADGYISGTTVAANAARFTTSYEGRGVHFVEGENKLYVGKYSCLCGANCGGATAGCNGQKVVWTAWSSESNNKLLPASTGNYYLTDSFTVSNQTGVAAGAQIRLDLNGQTVTRNDYRLYALNKDADAQGNYSALYVTDNSTSGNGTLKSILDENASYNGQGTVIWACKGNDFTLLRGNLDATGMITSGRGSAVSADDVGTVFKMYGGTVSGGTGSVGGTIGSSNGNVEIYGGTVNAGTATTAGDTIYSAGSVAIHGGTVNGELDIRGSLTVDETAGEVTLGTVLLKSADMSLTDAPAIASIALSKESDTAAMSAITLGTLTNTTPYSITVDGDGYFTTATVEANASKFAATEGKGVFFDQASSKLFIGMEHCLCGGNGNTDTANGGTCVGATEGCDSIVRVWKPTASRPTTSGNWYLTQDLTVTAATTVKEELDINLDLNGYDVIIRTNNEGGRMYSMLNSGDAKISILFTNAYRGTDRTSSFIVDDSKHDDQETAPTGGDQGRIVWFGGTDKHVKAYNVDFDMSKAAIRNNAEQNGIAFNTTGAKDKVRNDLKLYNCDFIGGNADGSLISIGAYTDVVFHDSTITGHTGSTEAGGILFASTVSTLTFSGNSYVSGCKTKTGTNGNILVVNNAEITLAESYTGTAGKTTGILSATYDATNKAYIVDPIADDSSRTVAVGVNGTNITEAQQRLFASDNANVLGLLNGELRMFREGTRLSCVCGATDGRHISFTDASGALVGCQGHVLTWKPLTKLEDLETAEGGKFYLTKNWETEIQIDLQTDAVNYLDLNGYTIKDTSARLFSTNGATNTVFTVTDTYAGTTSTDRPGGAIISDLGDTQREDYGTGFWLKGAGCTVNWFNATLDMSKIVMTKQGGCAFYSDTGTTLNIFSGDIVGGTAQKHSTGKSNAQGGAIRSSGTVNLFGGTIRDGKSEQNGGNIHMNAGVLNVYGSEIKGGSIGKIGGTFNANDSRANVVLQGAAAMNMYGGTIDGRVAGFNSPTGTVRISGDAVLRAAEDTATSNNLTVNGNPIVVSELSEKALVYLTSTAASFTVTMEGTPMTLEQVNARLIAPGYTASISGNIITFTKNP